MNAPAARPAWVLLGSVVPVSAGVSKTAQTAWVSFAAFIVLFILGALFVRHRRTQRPLGGGNGVAETVDAWAKHAPPKDNGKAGAHQAVAAGEWERDA